MSSRSLYAIAPHLSRAECEAITKRVLGFSTAAECRVSVNSGMRQNTRFAVNQISTAGDDYNATVTIRSVIGKKVASVTLWQDCRANERRISFSLQSTLYWA